jgi:hypothetical protein
MTVVIFFLIYFIEEENLFVFFAYSSERNGRFRLREEQVNTVF